MCRSVLPSLLIALALGVGGCGGSSDSTPDPSAAPSTAATAAPAAPAPEALSDFACAPSADGLWSASGTISNTGDTAESFTVDVYVGPADGQERPANRTELENVQPGGSTPLAVTGLSAQGDPAQCHVRVLRALP